MLVTEERTNERTIEQNKTKQNATQFPHLRFSASSSFFVFPQIQFLGFLQFQEIPRKCSTRS